jgi:predicted AlkP superfamily pyrophosphatase or phosphodiesterase
LLVNAGYTAFESDSLNETQKVLSQEQFLLPKPMGPHERHDAITFFLAKEYLQQHHPKVLQISFIETDAFGHQDKYDSYLESAHNCDIMLKDLWNTIQQDPFYKDQTTLFIATDHGRGDKADWTHHDNKTPGSDQIWFAVMGPYTLPLGEMKNQQVYQNQYAKTMAALLGLEFNSPHTIGEAIENVIRKK